MSAASSPQAPELPRTSSNALAWWARRAPWEVVGLLGFLLAVLSWFVAVRAMAAGAGWGSVIANHWWHGYVVAWMLAISVMSRTIGVRDVIATWFVGSFTVMVVVDAFALPIMDVTGQSDLFVEFLVPFIEEFAKAAMLVGWVVVRWRRRSQHHGILDLVILGFVVGGGFGVHEDALASRQVASGLGGWGWLFPTFLIRPSQFAIAHAGWGALIGLGVGAASLYRHRVVPALVLFLAPFSLAVIDHGAVNAGASSWAGRVSGGGKLAAWTLLLGIAAALVFELTALRRSGRLGLPLSREEIVHGWHRAPGALDRVVALSAVPRYHRARIAASFAHLVGRADYEDVARIMSTWRGVVQGAPP